MYECFHCLQKAVIWDNDFTLEEYGIEAEEGEQGVVHVCHCTNCGAEIEYVVRFNDDKKGE